MRKILYLLTKGPGESPLNVLPKDPPKGEEISVILLQDGVLHRQISASHVYTLFDDGASKAAHSSLPSVSYQDVLRMMFEADAVVVL